MPTDDSQGLAEMRLCDASRDRGGVARKSAITTRDEAAASSILRVLYRHSVYPIDSSTKATIQRLPFRYLCIHTTVVDYYWIFFFFFQSITGAYKVFGVDYH